MQQSEWKNAFDIEINQAEEARLGGNEGRARVCARRAAGIVVGEYLNTLGYTGYGPSAYDRIKFFTKIPGISPDVKQIANHFLVRVSPDFTLPINADLISDARWIANNLPIGKDIDMDKPYIYYPNLQNEMPAISSDSIISRTIHDNDQIKVILFGFAKGQELSEHTASMPAIFEIIQGNVAITLGKDKMEGQPGTWVHMPANLPHSIYAKSEAIMLLILLKNK